MRVVAIIQARMGSTRLPGKVMMKIQGKTVLDHVISRVKQSKGIDSIVIATTTKSDDDTIVEEANRLNIKYFRGSEDDVLSRYYYAAKENKADVVVRITSDCPLIDSEIIDKMIAKYKYLYREGKVDYLSNTLERTFPRGLDAEVFSFKVLEDTYYNAEATYQREHVTPYIYENPEIFKLESYTCDKDYSQHRWTLDTPEDFEMITKIYVELYNKDELILFNDIINLLRKQPEIIEINNKVNQKDYEDNFMNGFRLVSANVNDCDLLYEWANDQEVRKNSFNTNQINYEEHIKWFRDKLSSNNTYIYIFKNENDPIGVIRLDKLDDMSMLINYSIDKKHRGNGYATKLLKLIRIKYTNYVLIGKVKEENIGSIKAFLKAGYFKEQKINYLVFYSEYKSKR